MGQAPAAILDGVRQVVGTRRLAPEYDVTRRLAGEGRRDEGHEGRDGFMRQSDLDLRLRTARRPPAIVDGRSDEDAFQGRLVQAAVARRLEMRVHPLGR